MTQVYLEPFFSALTESYSESHLSLFLGKICCNNIAFSRILVTSSKIVKESLALPMGIEILFSNLDSITGVANKAICILTVGSLNPVIHSFSRAVSMIRCPPMTYSLNSTPVSSSLSFHNRSASDSLSAASATDVSTGYPFVSLSGP